jgi:hypothetical protein
MVVLSFSTMPGGGKPSTTRSFTDTSVLYIMKQEKSYPLDSKEGKVAKAGQAS